MAVRLHGPNVTLVAGSVDTAELAANAVTSAKVEADLIQYADKQVTNTEMLALLGTDVVLVASPGAGRGLVVHYVQMVFDVTTTGYTIGSAALAIGYASDGGDIVAITEAGFLDQATDQIRIYIPGGAAATPYVVTPVADKGVVLRATAADMTGGNAANTLSIRVCYSVVDMVAFS